MDPERAKRHVPEPSLFEYSTRDSIIYALGINCIQPHFLYENHEDFQVFPTYVVAPGFRASSLSDWPGIPFDLTRILHGEQFIEIFEPLPADGGVLRSETRVSDVLDKGSGALMLVEVTTFDHHTNKKLARQQFGVFQLGAGNFGNGARSSPHEIKAPTVPTRAPDLVVEEATNPTQAALYRQGGGDLNPLHMDPQFAKAAGFPQPILHGLCSLGIAAKQMLHAFGNDEAASFGSMKVRFSAPVLPGQTLQTEMWREGNTIHFQSRIKETGKVVLANGYVKLNKVVTEGVVVEKGSESEVDSSSLKSKAIFDAIEEELSKGGEAVEKVDSLILYEITRGEGKGAVHYTLDLLKKTDGSKPTVYCGKPKDSQKPTATVTISDDDFVSIASGQLDGLKAFLSGRLKVKGNVMILQKLQGILAAARAQRSKL